MDDATRGVKAMMDAAIDARMPLMLVGAPGTGKTATVKQIAKERGYKLITLVGSRMDPTDITGLPKGVSMGNDENGEPIEGTAYLSPYWQVEILRHKKVILFLDEFSNSSGSIQAAFLTLLQDREFANGHKFPEETVIMGASNPVEEAADGYEMALPTTNRIFWISWEPTNESWIQGMQTAWGANVSDEEMKWKRKIASFINDNPTWLHQPPKEGGTTEHFNIAQNNHSAMEVYRSAWASRRSWDNLSRVLSKAPDDVFIQDSIGQGIVGYPATAAFREYLRKHDKISPADVLADPGSVDWKNISIDDANLLFRAIVEMIDNDNAEQSIAVFEAVADAEMQSLAGGYVLDALRAWLGPKMSNEQKKKNRALASAVTEKYKSVTKHSR